MVRALEQDRPPLGHRAGQAVLLAVIAGLVAVACADLASGKLLTGVTALLCAGLGCAAAFFLRLNWRLLQVNRALIGQNARLLRRNAELCAGREEPAAEAGA